MEIIRGKHTPFIEPSALVERLIGYDTVHMDIGTGDGRFVQRMAQVFQNGFVVGLDACRENLHKVSRTAPENTLFIIGSAHTVLTELSGLATSVTINFPWGSLLEGLVGNDPALLAGLAAVACPKASLEVHLNAGALAEVGWSLEEGADQVRHVLAENGFTMRPPIALAAQELKALPTTWAKRLAFGRDPRAVYLRGIRRG